MLWCEVRACPCHAALRGKTWAYAAWCGWGQWPWFDRLEGNDSMSCWPTWEGCSLLFKEMECLRSEDIYICKWEGIIFLVCTAIFDQFILPYIAQLMSSKIDGSGHRFLPCMYSYLPTWCCAFMRHCLLALDPIPNTVPWSNWCWWVIILWYAHASICGRRLAAHGVP